MNMSPDIEIVDMVYVLNMDHSIMRWKMPYLFTINNFTFNFIKLCSEMTWHFIKIHMFLFYCLLLLGNLSSENFNMKPTSIIISLRDIYLHPTYFFISKRRSFVEFFTGICFIFCSFLLLWIIVVGRSSIHHCLPLLENRSTSVASGHVKNVHILLTQLLLNK